MVVFHDADPLVEGSFSNNRPQGLCDVFRADGTERDDAGESSLINKVCVDYSKEESHSHGRDGIVHVNQGRGAVSDSALEQVIAGLTSWCEEGFRLGNG